MARFMSYEFDLEVVVPAPLRTLGGERGCAAERRRVEARSGQGCFHPRDAPRLGSNPAEGDAGLSNAPTIYIERHGSRHDRELERGAVAYLEVVRVPRRRACWHRVGPDHLARLKHRFDVRRGTRKSTKIAKGHGALPPSPSHFNCHIERNQRDR